MSATGPLARFCTVWEFWMEFIVLVAAVCIVRIKLMRMWQALAASVQVEEVLFCQVSAGCVVEAKERGWSASRVRKGRWSVWKIKSRSPRRTA